MGFLSIPWLDRELACSKLFKTRSLLVRVEQGELRGKTIKVKGPWHPDPVINARVNMVLKDNGVNVEVV